MMKAICIDRPGDTEELQMREVSTPKPSRNEVLVKIKSASFNPVDSKMRLGVFPLNYPAILGCDFSGVIEKKGDLVRDFNVGDEVFGLGVGPASNGSYAESICLPIEFIAKKPKNLSFDEAASVPVAYLTAFQAMIAKGALQQNRPLFIAGGSGGVGSAAISLCKAYGAGPVFTIAGSEESAKYLKESFSLPDHHIIRYQGLSTLETAEKLIAQNEGNHFYFCLDFVGKKAKELCFHLCDYYGHVATILPEDKHFPIPIWGRGGSLIWQKSLSVHMIYSLAAAMSQDPRDWMVYRSQLAHLSGLFESGELLRPIIENVGNFSIQTVQKAHLRLEEGHTKGKLVMTVSDSN